MLYSKFRQKEVINVLDGRSLGCIVDMEVDAVTGKICSLILPGQTKLCNIFKSQSYVIPWCNICKIGEDVILVEIDSSCVVGCN